jgi:hypothetical protein
MKLSSEKEAMHNFASHVGGLEEMQFQPARLDVRIVARMLVKVRVLFLVF